MSNIDKQALREAAEKATKGQWQFHERQSLSHSGSGFVAIAGKEAILCFNAPVGGINQSCNVLKYIAAANPATVLALLDELEAKERRNAELNSTMECWAADRAQSASELDEADNRIAEVESQRRMAFMACNRWADKFREAEKRIAELEVREVVLPSTQDVHPLGPQSAKIFCEFHRSIVNRCADEIRKVGVKVSIKGN